MKKKLLIIPLLLSLCLVGCNPVSSKSGVVKFHVGDKTKDYRYISYTHLDELTWEFTLEDGSKIYLQGFMEVIPDNE